MHQWPLFICYRQSDGYAVAERLHALLNNQPLPYPHGGSSADSPLLDVYVDRLVPIADDWTKVHEPHLKRSRAMIVICTPGAKINEGRQDWVHREITWWITNRNIAPILVDALGEGERYVPDPIAAKWPNAQRIELVEDQWSKLATQELQRVQKATRDQLISSILPSGTSTYQQELEEERGRRQELEQAVWRLRVTAMTLALAVLAAVVGGLIARCQTLIAIENQKTALWNQSASLAAQSDAIRESLPQRSVLLAAEAVNIWRTNQLAPVVSAEQSLRDSVQHLGGIGLCGHAGPVMTVAISSDGRWLVTGSADKTARLWDLSSETPESCAHVLQGHTDSINAVAFSPDGRWLVSGSADKTARLWDLSSETPESCAHVLQGHTDSINAVAFSPDGRWLGTGCRSGIAQLWDLERGAPEKPERVVQDFSLMIDAISVGPHAAWLLAGSQYRTSPVLWEFEEGKSKQARLSLGSDWIQALAICQSGRWVVTSSQAGYDNMSFLLWDLYATRPEESWHVLRGHEDSVRCAASTPDGRKLVTGSADSTARVWDTTNLDECVHVLSDHQDSVNGVAIDASGRWVATGSSDKSTRLWDLATGRPEESARVLRGHDGPVTSVAIGPNGRWCATGSSDHTARLWDLNLTEPGRYGRVFDGHEDWVRAVSISRDGRWLATGSFEEHVRLYDLAADLPEDSCRFARHGAPIETVLMSSNNRWLVTGGTYAKLWDLRPDSDDWNPKRLGDATIVTLSPDGRWLCTVSFLEDTAYLWDLFADSPEKSGRPIEFDKGFAGMVSLTSDPDRLAIASISETGIAFQISSTDGDKDKPKCVLHNKGLATAMALAPNGRWLLAGINDAGRSVAMIWDLGAEAPENSARDLGDHLNSISIVAFSPSGRWFVICTNAGTAQLWSLGLEECSARVLNHSVNTLRFSHDSRWLGTAGLDGTVKLWDLEAEQPEKASQMLRGHEERVDSLTFSHDGNWLVTASVDKSTRLWPLGLDHTFSRAKRSVGRNFTREEWEELFAERYRKTFPMPTGPTTNP